MDFDVILALFRSLAAQGVRYSVVGGVALNLHGLPRATADLDLFVAADPENVARLRSALLEVFSDPSVEEIRAEDLEGDYPAIQYIPPDGGFHVDILSRLGEAFSYDDIESEVRDVEGVAVNVATPRMLVRMKRDTVRAQDRADAERLMRRFDLEDD